MSERLYRRVVGEGPAVAMCHGLFGQGRNWNRIAKAIAADPGRRCILLDMPNHGRSPWVEEFDYLGAADHVAEDLAADGPLSLVGHSMGGKIAMLIALRHPHLVERLVVVDISPVDYAGLSQFDGFVTAMRGLDLDGLDDRRSAERALEVAVPDKVIRGFLLQNLRRSEGRWGWQMNLDALGSGLDALGGWPEVEAGYEGPVLWVGGQNSPYIKPEYGEAMRALFPRVRQATVKNAGHWVHSEQPETFVALLRNFLRRPVDPPAG